MAYLVKEDLTTRIYEDTLDEITREDDTIITKAINAAVKEAKAYLAKFDRDALFGTDTADPAVDDEWLKNMVKDLTAWHLIKLSNANISYASTKECYDDAIKTLKLIMRGDMQPDGWPYLDTSKIPPPPDGDQVFARFGGNPNNSF